MTQSHFPFQPDGVMHGIKCHKVIIPITCSGLLWPPCCDQITCLHWGVGAGFYLLSTVLSMKPFSLNWKSSWAVSSLASPPRDTDGSFKYTLTCWCAQRVTVEKVCWQKTEELRFSEWVFSNVLEDKTKIWVFSCWFSLFSNKKLYGKRFKPSDILLNTNWQLPQDEHV